MLEIDPALCNRGHAAEGAAPTLDSWEV